MYTIRRMTARDKDCILQMMRTFYQSPALATHGSEDVFIANVEACLYSDVCLDGYVVCHQEQVVGYAMVARSFSTEYGRPCAWIEDLYIADSHRGKGVGGQMLRSIRARYPQSLLRLEVAPANTHAIEVYRHEGFETMPYIEMYKE